MQSQFKERADAPKHSFKVYPGGLHSVCKMTMTDVVVIGTTHGFGARPNLSIPKVKEAWEEYISDTVTWVKETL